MKKQFIPSIILNNGKAVAGFKDTTVVSENPVELAVSYNDENCDAILVFDQSFDDESHDKALDILKEICTETDVPVIGAGNVKRMEDIKKLLYAGCKMALLNFSKEGNAAILEEVAKKFGKEKIGICYADTKESCAIVSANEVLVHTYASEMVLLPYSAVSDLAEASCNGTAQAPAEESVSDLPHVYYLNTCSADAANTAAEAEQCCTDALKAENAAGVTGSLLGNVIKNKVTDVNALREAAAKAGLSVTTFDAKFKWADFKLDASGLVPVIVQDYRTDQVLMLAYMNEESYNATLKSGKMTYFSRSRQELWENGDTSGHFQYVKSLSADCDMDTILAKVKQIGAACHTGSYSCFFNEIAHKEYQEKNPQKVLDSVYSIIADRKIHPREGSYTNYLFDKGLDKILKKCGEEATEITIAAKNPNENEIVYEMADYLYHMMVLMAEKDVRWEDITDELARR